MLGHELRNPLAAITNAGELTRLLDPEDESFDEALGNHPPAGVADEAAGRRSARRLAHHERSRAAAEIDRRCGGNRQTSRRIERCVVLLARPPAAFEDADGKGGARSRPLSARASPVEPAGELGEVHRSRRRNLVQRRTRRERRRVPRQRHGNRHRTRSCCRMCSTCSRRRIVRCTGPKAAWASV